MINPLNAYIRWARNYASRIYRLSGYSISLNFLEFSFTYLPIIELALVIAYIILLITHLMALVVLSALFIVTLVIISIFSYVLIKVHTRMTHINRAIVNTLIAAVPLMASGVTLQELINSLYNIERDPEVKRELGLVIRDVMSGSDIIKALEDSIDRVSSPLYRDVISLLVNSYMVSSSVADVLMLKVDYLIRDRYNKLRSVVQTLGLLMESYLVITLLLPVLLILIAITLTPLGPLTIGSLVLDPTVLLLITVFFYSPLMGFIMYLLIDSTMTSIE